MSLIWGALTAGGKYSLNCVRAVEENCRLCLGVPSYWTRRQLARGPDKRGLEPLRAACESLAVVAVLGKVAAFKGENIRSSNGQ